MIITGHGTIETAVGAMKTGAYDFIEKPFSTSTTLNVVRKALEKQQAHGRESRAAPRLEEIQGMDDIIGNSDVPCAAALETARQVASSKATVLLTGESGTGKEVFATAIHRWSDRSQAPHGPGQLRRPARDPAGGRAFRLRDRAPSPERWASVAGRFEAAHGGTLFLDEVGEMNP